MDTTDPRDLLDDEGELVPVWRFLGAHQALRRDAARFRAASSSLAQGDGDPAEGLEAMAEHWGRYHVALELHHDTEDEGLFPMLRSAQPDLAGVIDRLDEDHHRLLPLLEELDRLVAVALADRRAERLGALADGFERLEALLVPHLATEEEHLVPAMLQHLAGPPGGGGPQGPPEVPLPESFVWAWSFEHLPSEVLSAVLQTMPPETAEQVPTWLGAYREDLARWWTPVRATQGGQAQVISTS